MIPFQAMKTATTSALTQNVIAAVSVAAVGMTMPREHELAQERLARDERVHPERRRVGEEVKSTIPISSETRVVVRDAPSLKTRPKTT